ncbi:putative Protein kinase domain-containing protein [Seiridium cardinale]
MDAAAEDTNWQPTHHFRDWVDVTQLNYAGHDLLDNQLTYIPHSELKSYWDIRRITAILTSYDKPLPYDARSIQSDYLRIFSALVFTSNTRRFLGLILNDSLDDTKWPLVDYPSRWHQPDAESSSAFKALKKAQWIFFPYSFRTSRLNDARLDPDCILPIEYLETITQFGGSTIQKIRIHDGYNDLSPAPKGQFLVLKDYDLTCPDIRDRTPIEAKYRTEIEALTMLSQSPSDNLITFYGSFRKDGHATLILEFADAGNLDEFYRNNPPPTTAADISLFWARLLQSLSGLDRIHQLMSVGINNKNIIQGIHQDIKPANIVLFKGPSDSPYDFNPKIADFGLFSHARKTQSNNDEAKGSNKYGTQVYSAPESSVNFRNKTKGISLITPGADIFSFGAVLSEAASWVMGGQPLREQYLQRRKSAHAKLKRFPRTGYEGCFHAGMERFSVTEEMHSQIKTHCKDHGYDHVTPKILDIVQNHMLLPISSERYQASALIDCFADILLSEPLSPIIALSSRRTSTWMSSNTGGDGESTPTSMGSIQQINTFFQSKVLDSTVKNLVDQITRNLRDRDQFFFIDDSTSMQEHRSIVLEGFEALSSIAKRLDPNRVELAFASEPKRVHRARSTKSLVKKLKKHEYRHDPTMMEKSLSELVEHQIIRKLPVKKMGFNINPISRKRVSVYIFTDGNWGDDPRGACRVESPVKDLIAEVQRRKLSRHQVTLHFGRFGESEEGGRHLDFLDHFGEQFDCDIVDVKHISSDVASFLIGPLTLQNDRRDEERRR